MYHLFLVALGGAIGAGCRHLIGLAALRLLGAGFPWGTLFVNVLGSLLMGLLVGYFAHRSGVGNELKLFLTTGILGGFTTFSAFSLDFSTLWHRGELSLAFTYVAGSVFVSILALMFGLWFIRVLTS